ncbi:MAG: hypothetical protein ACHQM6_04140 [Candidatus Kapaibacterium sp.]
MSEKLFVLIIGAAGFLACIIPVLLRPEHYPSDDSFFYLQVGSNIARGFGATFNRITMTNGFHPLWQFCCAGVFFLTNANKDSALLIICLIQQLLFVGIIYYLFRLNEFLRLRYWYLAIPILMFYFLCTGLYASEAYLHCLLVLILLYYFTKEMLDPEYSLKTWAGIGILGGLLFLARLDTIFLLGVFFIVAWKNLSGAGRPKYFKYLLQAVVPAVLVVIPYLFYNYATFGHVVPISGAIKSTFPHISANTHAIKDLGEIVTAAGVIGFLIAIFSSRNRGKRLIYLILSAGTLLLSLYLILFTDGNTRWGWYYVVGMVIFAFVIVHSFEFIAGFLFRKSEGPRIGISLVLYSVLMICAGFRSWEKYSNGDSQGLNIFQLHGKTDKKWQIEVALWLKNNLPKDTKIFIYDWPGMIAYYSDMNILPTDGLISDYGYNDSLRKESIGEYLSKNDVHYWIGHTTERPEESGTWSNKLNADGSQIVNISTPLYKTSAGSFTLTNERLVTDFRKSIPNPILPDLALWKLEP